MDRRTFLATTAAALLALVIPKRCVGSAKENLDEWCEMVAEQDPDLAMDAGKIGPLTYDAFEQHWNYLNETAKDGPGGYLVSPEFAEAIISRPQLDMAREARKDFERWLLYGAS